MHVGPRRILLCNLSADASYTLSEVPAHIVNLQLAILDRSLPASPVLLVSIKLSVIDGRSIESRLTDGYGANSWISASPVTYDKVDNVFIVSIPIVALSPIRSLPFSRPLALSIIPQGRMPSSSWSRFLLSTRSWTLSLMGRREQRARSVWRLQRRLGSLGRPRYPKLTTGDSRNANRNLNLPKKS